MEYVLLLTILLPLLSGIALLAFPIDWKKNKTGCSLFVIAVLLLTAALAVYTSTGERSSIALFNLVEDIPLYFAVDSFGAFFATIVSPAWLAVGIYGIVYMEHEGKEKRFFGYFLCVLGVLEALCFSGNLVTYYMFFELMTLSSFTLVLHNESRESIMASLKYMFFSMFGAYAVLFGIFVLNRYCDSLRFVAGGSLNSAAALGHENLLLAAILLSIVGFGVKAGMLPFHAWLPTAHPVAPSPASAVLSAIIAKFGVLGILRVVYFVAGKDFVKGTYVQTVWIVLALSTVFMGSMLAYREKVFKKRLAYSTVSQVSYILLGLALMTEQAFTGALLHVAAHAMIKTGLFLTAGVFIYRFGFTKVEELKGLGRKMPVLFWSYTFLALGLIGIPPTLGFVSKWYLALGSLQSGFPVISYLAVAVLLVSALLTAGYLLPITINGFFRESEKEIPAENCKLSLRMLLPIVFFAAMTVFLGIFPDRLLAFIEQMTQSIFG